jgi:DnaJ-class molecular chaperone
VQVYSLISVKVKKKWFSDNRNVREKTQQRWHNAQKAHRILSHPDLRAQYDAGRVGIPLAPSNRERKKLQAPQIGTPGFDPEKARQEVLARKKAYDEAKERRIVGTEEEGGG